MQAFIFMKIIRTNSKNSDFISLVNQLDAFLSVYNGDQNDIYTQYNSITLIENCVVSYHKNGKPISCGAFKKIDDHTIEIKRMFTLPEFRNLKFAKHILGELENWAKELGFSTAILETGIGLKNAQKLYENAGYFIIPNFEQYKDLETSICYKKNLLFDKNTFKLLNPF